MATISEMLLEEKENRIPKGDLEVAREVVKKYKELIENDVRNHRSCKHGEMIGLSDYCGNGQRYIGYCGHRVCYSYIKVSEELIAYLLRQEGLYMRKIEHGRYETMVGIYII